MKGHLNSSDGRKCNENLDVHRCWSDQSSLPVLSCQTNERIITGNSSVIPKLKLRLLYIRLDLLCSILHCSFSKNNLLSSCKCHLSLWFANEVHWIKLICLDRVHSCGACIDSVSRVLICILHLGNYIPPRCASHLSYLWHISLSVSEHLLNTLPYYTLCGECYKLTDISSTSQVCLNYGKHLSALPANFSVFDLFSFPLSSFCYSCLAFGLVLTVFFGSRRICHCEGDDESPLITPCHCTGSLRFVHQACLQQWIKSSDTRCCELCKYEFIMETKLKPLRKVKHSVHAYSTHLPEVGSEVNDCSC